MKFHTMRHHAWVIVALVIASLGVGSRVSMADAQQDQRMLLIGRAVVAPDGTCTATGCPGRLRASIYRGTPAFLFGLLDVPIQVEAEADAFTLCRKVTGRGFLKEESFAVRFVGTLCTLDPGARFGLTGQLQIFANTLVCAAQNERAAVGTLEVFGSISSPTMPIPVSNGSLASVVGVSGSMPICDP